MALDLVSFRKELVRGTRALLGLKLSRIDCRMAVAGPRKFVLDTRCFVDASRGDAEAAALVEFSARAAPGLYLSTVVAAELNAGAGSARNRRTLERQILSPYIRRGRLVNPSPAAWEVLGTTLAALVEEEGLVPREVRRSFVSDILIARSCREIGAPLVSTNSTDLSRIAKEFSFDFVAPCPIQGAD